MRALSNQFARFGGWCVLQLRLFFIALQFFTRLPIPQWVGFEPGWLNQASRYFVMVGVLVGLLSAIVYGLAILILPKVVAVILVMVFGVLLTGAFHEDGFADVCDGFGGGYTPERVLEIMKDSRVGAFGVIGMVLMLGLKAATLISIPTHAIALAFIIAHPLSRLASTVLIWRLRYVRGEGKAKPLAETMRGSEFAFACVTAWLATIYVHGKTGFSTFSCILAWLAAMASAWAMARWFVRRIGGYTGDCLGAVQQVAEVAIYLALLASLQHGLRV